MKGKSLVRNQRNLGIKTMVKQMIDAKREHKLYTNTFSYVDTVAGVVTEMSRGITIGDTISSRDGDVIFPSRLVINYSLLSGVGSTNSFHRVVIFQDTMNTGVLPLIGEVLSSGLYVGTYNVVNLQQKRYKIIYDQMHGVVGASNSAASHFQKSLSLKGMIHYQSTGNTVADNGKNSLFILTCTDSVVVGTAIISASWNLHYTDA